MTGPGIPHLDGLRPPEPPGELRRRVLAKVRAEIAGPATPDLWTRLWTSRRLRLAWAATVVGLLAANMVVHWPAAPRSPSGRAPLAASLTSTQPAEVAELAELPRIGPDPVILVAFDQPDSTVAAPGPANPRTEGSS